MNKLTIIFGLVLILTGLIGYFGTGGASITALIPAFLGIIFVITGVLALKENFRKHSMHVAVMFAVIGLAGSFRGLVQLPALITGGEVLLPTAVILQSIMAIVCGVYIGLSVKSFIDARKKSN